MEVAVLGLGAMGKANALARNEAASAGTPVPLAQLVAERMRSAVELGFGEDGWSIALAKVARR